MRAMLAPSGMPELRGRYRSSGYRLIRVAKDINVITKVSRYFQVIICGLFLTVDPVVAQFNVGSLENQAKDISKRIKPHLPMKSSGSLTLISVNQSSGLLVYEHTLDVFFPPENKPLMLDWLRGQTYKSACSVPDLINFVDRGGSLYYRFFYSNEVLINVKVERCH